MNSNMNLNEILEIKFKKIRKIKNGLTLSKKEKRKTKIKFKYEFKRNFIVKFKKINYLNKWNNFIKEKEKRK